MKCLHLLTNRHMALHNLAANALETGGRQETEIIDGKQVGEHNDNYDITWLTSSAPILTAGGGDDCYGHQARGRGHPHSRRRWPALCRP